MAFDIQAVKSRFNAGIAAIAVNSRTAAEQSITQLLATEIAAVRKMQVKVWDAGTGLQSLTLTRKANVVNGFDLSPEKGVETAGHPVANLLKYMISAGKTGEPPVLFILKDLYPYIAAKDSNPALVRLAIDACFALKRSQHRLVILHDGWSTPTTFLDLIADLSNPLPDELEATNILQYRLEALQKSAKTVKQSLPIQLETADRKRLVRSLLGMTQEGMEDAIQLVATSQRRVDATTVEAIAKIKQNQFAARGIEYAQAPDVPVQGMPALSDWATTQAALLEPAAREEWNIPFPKGLLLVGEGGTGKTLGVKCLARTWGLPIVVLDTSKLMQKELGASEQNLRETIAAAEAMAPAILFIDEMDKMFPGGGQESDGGTASRMFGYFLQWFQNHESAVFVAATANEPWKFKPEMLRRFSQVFYVDLPNTAARKDIFRVQMQRYKLIAASTEGSASEALLETLARLTPDFTGDEIRKIVHESAATAYAAGHPGQISLEAFQTEIRAKPPQFRSDAKRLELLRQWASSGQARWVAPDRLQAPATPTNDRQVNWETVDLTGEAP
jgi:DNA replication protein DnaC